MDFEVLLVVGSDAVGIARFPRLLHDAGCRVTLLAPPGLAVARSRYVTSHVATAGEAELNAAFELLDEGNGVMLVQQFVDGRVGSSDVLFDRGVPACWQSWYSRLCWPTPLASSCAREAMFHRDIGPMLAGVGALSGFHGFAGVDWMHDAERDRVYLIEFNPRPTPTYHLDAHSGVSFAGSFRAMLEGTRGAGCREPSAAACGSVIHLFPQSLYRAVGERDLDSLWRCWSDAPWSDPLLIAAYLRRVFTHFLPMRWRQAVKRLLLR